MADTLRVGLIGASAKSGWARESHVPAVQGLEGLELVAVATSDRRGAEESAHAFGARKAFGDGLELARDPDVDIVTVATRVPGHRPLVLAALAAGKHVGSEWPLGADSVQAEEMASAARAAGVHTAIGLQVRASPAVAEARRRLADEGGFGRLRSLGAFSSVAGFGPEVPAPFLYLEDPASFANLVTIQGAHTLDLALLLAGGLEGVAALLSRQFPEYVAGDSGERRRRTTYDHMLAQARATAGAPVAVEVAGDRPPETPFRLEAIGAAGAIALGGGAPRGFQSGRLTLSVDGEAQAVDEGELASLPDGAVNVGGVYAALRDDIRGGARTVTGFDHAVRLTRLMEEILAAPDGGLRASAVAGAWS